MYSLICAAKEIRTPTPFRALPPQSSASTNFAIAAGKNLQGLSCLRGLNYRIANVKF